MWVTVDEERVTASPHFGVKGALQVVLWLMIAAGLFGVWRSVIPLIHFLTRDMPQESYTIWLTVLLALRFLVSVWVVHAAFGGLNGLRSFPGRATAALLALLVVNGALVALFIIEREGDEIMLRRVLPELTAALAFAVLVLLYLQLSRRVNATYRWRLRRSEAA
jgi:hypothetical protein